MWPVRGTVVILCLWTFLGHLNDTSVTLLAFTKHVFKVKEKKQKTKEKCALCLVSILLRNSIFPYDTFLFIFLCLITGHVYPIFVIFGMAEAIHNPQLLMIKCEWKKYKVWSQRGGDTDHVTKGLYATFYNCIFDLVVFLSFLYFHIHVPSCQCPIFLRFAESPCPSYLCPCLCHCPCFIACISVLEILCCMQSDMCAVCRCCAILLSWRTRKRGRVKTI